LSSNIIDYIRAGPKTTRQDINKILAELQDINAQDPEDAALQKRIALWDGGRKRTSSVGKSGAADQSKSFTRDRRTEEVTMEMPTTCDSSTLTLTEAASGTTFSATSSNGGTKYGGRGESDATGYFTIANDALLNVTDALTVATFFFLPSAGAASARILLRHGTTFSTNDGSWGMEISGAEKLRWKMRTDDGGGSTETLASSAISTGAWHSHIGTYLASSNRMRQYVDGTKIGGDLTTAGTLVTHANNLGIIASGDGTDKLESGMGLAWVMVLNEEVDQTWVTNYHAGHFDFSGGNMIFFLPFVGNAELFTEATTNYCVSS